MEPENIILYHTRLQGYQTRGGTYGTALSEAKRFTASAAITAIKRAKPGDDGASPLIPVNLDILNQTQAQ
jgi:hypothetical protein